MSVRRALSWLVGLMLAGLTLTNPALAADDPCGAFKWNVTVERAVFSQKPQATTAGRNASSAPELKTKTLYELSLAPQETVKFVASPGKKGLPDGAFAGVVHFQVPQTGTYRVALDQGFWIDVVSHEKLIESKDFTGAHDCSAPRKIVQYDLPAGEDLVLQLSGATKDHVRVAVTPARTEATMTRLRACRSPQACSRAWTQDRNTG